MYQLEHSNQQLAPFAEKVRQLANQFATGKIRKLAQEGMENTG